MHLEAVIIRRYSISETTNVSSCYSVSKGMINLVSNFFFRGDTLQNLIILNDDMDRGVSIYDVPN